MAPCFQRFVVRLGWPVGGLSSPQRERPRATALPRALFPYFFIWFCRGLQPAPIAVGFRYSTPTASAPGSLEVAWESGSG